jgi:dipeptidyl aminopeptidase/acylaminoacyl peptidase
MIAYIYEKMSDGLHQYRTPVEWSPYNQQVLSQEGYFVFLPDIVYRDRQPGKSAVECLEPAVAAVLKKNVGVNPSKIGLMGHSWGGYQTAFAITQTRLFAAANAGAPLTELMSMYNSFYWNAGITDQVIFESSQGRMGVPWWEDMKAYMDNSPVFNAAKIECPLLVEQGDQDGAVDFHQGQQLYNTMRRMGKNIVFLVYNGENHNNAKKPNQLDYAKRQRHFFDVYLRGARPEPWLSEGLPFLKKDGG